MIIKRLLLTCATALAVATPSSATIDPGTADLLRGVQKYATVEINSDKCDDDPYMEGSYHTVDKVLTICVDGTADANDHDTVRHEAWHVLQSCLSPNLPMLKPLFNGEEEFQEYVLSFISKRDYNRIVELYPPSHVDVEVEAFVMARGLTAEQIEKSLHKACAHTLE